MKLLFATNNDHKITEVRALFSKSGIDVDLISLREAGIDIDPPETQDNFEGNALQKARFLLAQTQMTVIADDSGLVVDALDGAPGVRSKRFSIEETATANNALLLRKLAGITSRSARFACSLAVVSASGERCVTACCEGMIGHALVGEDGFGYDPLFWPIETPGKSMALLTMDQKNAISHRGQAFRKLPQLLTELGLTNR